jgi:hypothetical protein
MNAWLRALVPAYVATCTAFADNAGFILADRTNDTLYWVRDLDTSGAINEPTEIHAWFSAANAAGTLAPMNPTALATCYTCGGYGVSIMGDQLNRNIYLYRPSPYLNSAQGIGESIVAADATNASGVSFAFPTGVGFDSLGRAYVVNAGNASGNDGIYRCLDLNSDDDFQDAGEITEYVGVPVFGPGNGAYSPQEIVFAVGDVGYLRNSSTNLQGVFRFVDGSANGRADDAGEFALYFGAGNASGITVSAGFALEPDRLRPGALYMQQLATGGVDQILRLTDLNNDNDAQDAGEAVLVWSTAEAGFTSVDMYSTVTGKLYVTDNSAKRVIHLTDANADTLFDNVTERADFYAGGAIVGDVRQIAALPCPGDLNYDFRVDLSDLSGVLSNFGEVGRSYQDGDFDGDGDTDLSDLSRLLSNFGAACE